MPMGSATAYLITQVPNLRMQMLHSISPSMAKDFLQAVASDMTGNVV